MPTEAEWEYACRAGSRTAYYWGKDWDGQYAWCGENSGTIIHEVAGRKPNAWGLYDMSGNIWEWCQDSYEKNIYPFEARTDPIGPSGGKYRVLRGGSWYGHTEGCRSASRDRRTPGYRSAAYGFRVVRTP